MDQQNIDRVGSLYFATLTCLTEVICAGITIETYRSGYWRQPVSYSLTTWAMPIFQLYMFVSTIAQSSIFFFQASGF